MGAWHTVGSLIVILLNKLIDNKDLLFKLKKKPLYPEPVLHSFLLTKPYAINTNMFQTVHLNFEEHF